MPDAQVSTVIKKGCFLGGCAVDFPQLCIAQFVKRSAHNFDSGHHN